MPLVHRKIWMLAAAVSMTAGLALTPALSRDKSVKAPPNRIMSTKSLAQRTATCRADCLPDETRPKGAGFHGHYRSYNDTDPHLTSIEGRASYNKCVQSCLAPLPDVYVQRMVFGMGLSWFGQTKQSCLGCHVSAQRDNQPGH